MRFLLIFKIIHCCYKTEILNFVDLFFILSFVEFIHSHRDLVDSWVFYRNMSSSRIQSLISSFLAYMRCIFFFISWFFWLRVPVFCWIKVMKMNIDILFQIWKSFLFSSLSVWCELLSYNFTNVEVCFFQT